MKISLLVLLLSVGSYAYASKISPKSPQVAYFNLAEFFANKPKHISTKGPAKSYVLPGFGLAGLYSVRLIELSPGFHDKVDRPEEVFNLNFEASGKWVNPDDAKKYGPISRHRLTIYQRGNKHDGFQFTSRSVMFRLMMKKKGPAVGSPDLKADEFQAKQIEDMFEEAQLAKGKDGLWTESIRGTFLSAGVLKFRDSYRKVASRPTFLFSGEEPFDVTVGDKTYSLTKDSVIQIPEKKSFKVSTKEKSVVNAIWLEIYK